MTEASFQLMEVFQSVDPSAPSTAQMRPLQTLVAQVVGRPVEQVYAISVSRTSNLKKQGEQSRRALRAQILVVVLRSSAEAESYVAGCKRLVRNGNFEAVLVVGMNSPGTPSVASIVQAAGSPVGDQVQAWWGPLASQEESPTEGLSVATEATPAFGAARQAEGDSRPLIFDPRVKRMLRLAIASSKVVMLVGPPGTGKTSLLDEVLEEIRGSPASYGLANGPAGVMRVTPDEGWTTRELVGGETVDDKGRLRFRPGHVLESIRRDEWLFLDEANRADMDKIFGGLLTWLSRKPVTLDRASSAPGAPSVELTWSTGAASEVEGYERLADATGESIRFAAGTDWRIVGTYNALDAQRVFRFGHALGRRFSRVPVPLLNVTDFRTALRPYLDRLPSAASSEDVGTTLTALYAAHLETEPPLGPALFLAIPTYIANGFALLDLAEVTDGEESDAPDEPAGPNHVAATRELLAEGYLLGAGSWLANLDDSERESFRSRVVTAEGLLSDDQWTFIEELLPALA